jgi:hypothetical protein
MSKAIALGLSVVGGLLAVRQSRHRRDDRRRTITTDDRRYDTTTANGHHEATPQSHATRHGHRRAPPMVTSSSSSLGSLPLLLHALVAMAVMLIAPFFRPASIEDERIWLQAVGGALIGTLVTHVLALIATARFSALYAARHQQRQRRPSRTSTAPVETVREREALSEELRGSIAALNGLWIKDKELSDSMGPVCDLMSMPSILRMAIGLIRGVEIVAVPPTVANPNGEYSFAVLSGVLWFKIREKYTLDGVEVKHRRRDMRGGGAFGGATPADNGGVRIRTRFGAPMSGTMDERIHSPAEGLMHIDTTVTVGGGSVAYRQVYRKR